MQAPVCVCRTERDRTNDKCLLSTYTGSSVSGYAIRQLQQPRGMQLLKYSRMRGTVRFDAHGEHTAVLGVDQLEAQVRLAFVQLYGHVEHLCVGPFLQQHRADTFAHHQHGIVDCNHHTWPINLKTTYILSAVIGFSVRA